MAHKNNNEEDIVVEEEAMEQSTFKGKSDSKLRKELKQAQKEAKEYLDGWQRAKADLVNFKRENEENRQKAAQFANLDFILQLLPVMDSFEAALAHGESGVEQIYKQLLSVLKQNGVQQESPMGEIFDPSLHDSIESVKVENKKDDHTIVEVLQKGYTLHDKVIRPAKVKVGTYE